MNARDKLRKAAFEAKPAVSQFVTFDGNEFEIRQPTIGGRGDILKQSGLKKDGEMDNINDFQFALLLNCVYVPDSNDKVFEQSDKPAFLNQQPDGLYEVLIKACNEVFTAAPAEAAKN